MTWDVQAWDFDLGVLSRAGLEAYSQSRISNRWPGRFEVMNWNGNSHLDKSFSCVFKMHLDEAAMVEGQISLGAKRWYS